jgi:hypothetical protein
MGEIIMVTDQFIIETAEKAYAIGGMGNALAAAFAFVATVPEGWKLVPMEPTEEMCDVSHIGVDVYAGIATDEYYSIDGEYAAKVYRAMLAAAPKP